MSEKSLPQLPDELSALAARLRGLRASASVTESPASFPQAPRDRLMYRAGWAACETAHGWQADATDSSGDCVDNTLHDVTKVGSVGNAFVGVPKPRRVSDRTLGSRTWAIATAALLLISLTLGGMLLSRAAFVPATQLAHTLDGSPRSPIPAVEPPAPGPQPLNSFPILHSPLPILEAPAFSPQPQVPSLQPLYSDNYLALRTSALLTGVDALAYRLPRATAEESRATIERSPKQRDQRAMLQSLLGS